MLQLTQGMINGLTMKTDIRSPLFIALMGISLCSFAENPNISIHVMVQFFWRLSKPLFVFSDTFRAALNTRLSYDVACNCKI